MDRRTLLGLLGATSSAMLVGGCGPFRRPLKPLCTEPVTVNVLTIDVHGTRESRHTAMRGGSYNELRISGRSRGVRGARSSHRRKRTWGTKSSLRFPGHIQNFGAA